MKCCLIRILLKYSEVNKSIRHQAGNCFYQYLKEIVNKGGPKNKEEILSSIIYVYFLIYSHNLKFYFDKFTDPNEIRTCLFFILNDEDLKDGLVIEETEFSFNKDVSITTVDQLISLFPEDREILNNIREDLSSDNEKLIEKYVEHVENEEHEESILISVESLDEYFCLFEELKRSLEQVEFIQNNQILNNILNKMTELRTRINFDLHKIFKDNSTLVKTLEKKVNKIAESQHEEIKNLENKIVKLQESHEIEMNKIQEYHETEIKKLKKKYKDLKENLKEKDSIIKKQCESIGEIINCWKSDQLLLSNMQKRNSQKMKNLVRIRNFINNIFDNLFAHYGVKYLTHSEFLGDFKVKLEQDLFVGSFECLSYLKCVKNECSEIIHNDDDLVFNIEGFIELMEIENFLNDEENKKAIYKLYSVFQNSNIKYDKISSSFK